MPQEIPLLTNPDEVAIRGKERAASHWLLYDALAHRLRAGDDALAASLDQTLGEVMAGIDCTACGRCCQRMGPEVSPADMARLAEGLGASVAALQERLLRPMWPGASEADQVWLLPDPCPLHDGRLCTVYLQRPQVCRDFPQAVGADLVERLSIWVETARVCPITFNTLERLAAVV